MLKPSRDAFWDHAWPEAEETRFRLRIKELRLLQEKCDAGPPEIWNRLGTDRWFVDDVRETIRLGLIGGGKSISEANELVIKYVDGYPLKDHVLIAQAILAAALVGIESEPFEEVGANAESGKPATDDSSLSGSTASAPH